MSDKYESPFMKFFKYKHLPDHLHIASAPCCELAEIMNRELPPGNEKETGLRKLLEAKDCFVRALV